MMLDALIALVLVAIVSAVLWTYFTAQRLHRLHIRLDAALQSLQGALDRRAAVVAALIPDLAAQARDTEANRLAHGELDSREDAERELSASVNHRLTRLATRDNADDPDDFGRNVHPGTLHAELVDADVRVELAHRFYNEAVASTRGLRLRPFVKTFRLGGRAPLPDFFQYTSFSRS